MTQTFLTSPLITIMLRVSGPPLLLSGRRDLLGSFLWEYRECSWSIRGFSGLPEGHVVLTLWLFHSRSRNSHSRPDAVRQGRRQISTVTPNTGAAFSIDTECSTGEESGRSTTLLTGNPTLQQTTCHRRQCFETRA